MDSKNLKAAIVAVAALVVVGLIVRARRNAVEPSIAPSRSEERGVLRPDRRDTAARVPEAERAIVAPEAADAHQPLAAPPRPAVAVSQPQPTSQPPAPAADVADASDAAGVPHEAPPDDIPSLGHMALTDASPQRRVEAVDLLCGTEDPAAVPFLRQALSDPDSEVRLAIVKSLAEVDFTPDVTIDLLSTIITGDSEADNRLEALRVLNDVDSDRVAVLAKQALNDPDADVRALAKEILEPDEEGTPSDGN